MLRQAGCLKELDESLFVRERCRLRMGPNSNVGEPASEQSTGSRFRRREMPTPHLVETNRARSTDDPLDVTLRAALNDQLPSRHQNRSQVAEEPVMVAYPMKRCRGEHRIDGVVVGEDLRVKGQQISLNEPDFRSPRPKTPACLIEHRGGRVEGYDPSIRYPPQQLLRYSSCTAASIQNDLRPVEIKLVKDRLPPAVLGISNAVVTLSIPARRSRERTVAHDVTVPSLTPERHNIEGTTRKVAEGGQ